MTHPAGIAEPDFQCSFRGEIAGRARPSDDLYYLTSFGGGSDTQRVACGGRVADGLWYYLADSWRFGCGARVRITNPQNGASVVAQVIDVGPACWVEERAGGPIIDASPLVARHLFGHPMVGWSDRKIVRAEPVAGDTPLGPVGSGSSQLGWIVAGALAVAAGAWLLRDPPKGKRRG